MRGVRREGETGDRDWGEVGGEEMGGRGGERMACEVGGMGQWRRGVRAGKRDWAMGERR